MSVLEDIKQQCHQLSYHQIDQLQKYLDKITTDKEQQHALKRDLPQLKENWAKKIEEYLAVPKWQRKNTLRLSFYTRPMVQQEYLLAAVEAHPDYIAARDEIAILNKCTATFIYDEVSSSVGDYHSVNLLLTWPT